jgi:hypothetical protein
MNTEEDVSLEVSDAVPVGLAHEKMSGTLLPWLVLLRPAETPPLELCIADSRVIDGGRTSVRTEPSL